jgi:hypothetical protein
MAPLRNGVTSATVTPANCSPRVRMVHLGVGAPGCFRDPATDIIPRRAVDAKAKTPCQARGPVIREVVG